MKRILGGIALLFGAFVPNMAFADWGILSVDSLDISRLVPIIIDSFMFVANGTYEYFVGSNHDGIVYWLVIGVFAIYISLYLIKLYVPKFWLTIFGFKAEDTIDNVSGMKIGENLLKPAIRALVAMILLLPLHPEFITKYLTNPFLQFGSMYTTEIIKISTTVDVDSGKKIECPKDLLAQGWLDKESCEYIIQPVHVLSQANNAAIKRGFRYLAQGLESLTTLMVHNGGQGFMNIITGILMIYTFTVCNIFMALLVIQAIFNFGMALILYPFSIAAWVAKKSNSWMDIWPAFSGLVEALKQIIVTMIACAFILCINLALISALFQWNGRSFVAAAGGTAYSNAPSVTSASFGEHSLLWLSCLLTFFLMLRVFQITREKLTEYVGKDGANLYNKVKTDAQTVWKIASGMPGKIANVTKVAKGKK
ncbi:MAG: hypothetical protein J5608_00860 [Alphaproteobacteria bacterium]|nr:hypothetical protein [Alphaproteobacteria bacterium]